MKTFYRALLLNGASVAWLAKKMKVSTQTIYNWKLGKTKPRPAQIVKLSKLMGVNAEILIREHY